MELLKNLILRFRRVISFSLIGVINTALDFLVFTLCLSAFGLSPGTSQAAGYVAGVISSFIMNRTITFKDWTRHPVLQVALFIFVNAVSFFVTTNLIDLLTNSGLSAYLAKILVTGVSMVINYFGYKYLVFKVSGNGRESDAHE